MRVTVKDCINLESLKKGVVLTHPDSLERKVRSVSVLDGETIEQIQRENASKGQLVLTSFRGHEYDLNFQLQAIKLLAEAQVAGLVIFGATPEDLVKLIDVDKKDNFAVIVMDNAYGVTYSAIIEEVMEKLLSESQGKRGIISNAIYHLMNFEKHSHFQSALREAAVNNDFQVILLSPDFHPIMWVETRHNVTIADAIRMGREKDVNRGNIYTFVDINGITTYWGPIEINHEKYFLFIVDNEDQYSATEITRLAEIIELAMGMWKYTPERDIRIEFIKALMRNNKSLAYSLKDEMNFQADDIVSVFFAKGNVGTDMKRIFNEFETAKSMEILTIDEGEETFGVILRNPFEEEGKYKEHCNQLFDKLKEGNKAIRIFHMTGLDGIEGAADGFRIISETWSFVESIFPYKRVFTKYELALVSNCINIQVQGGYLKKTYMDLLEPFSKEIGETKARHLLETLETLVLDAGMNSVKTAEFMGIHANTVQYRLKRINEILGADLTGNRVIPGLTIALALKRLEG